MQGQIKAELLNCLKDEQKHSTLKKVTIHVYMHCSKFNLSQCHRTTMIHNPSLTCMHKCMQIGDTVSGLAETMKIDAQDSEWPELLPFLFSCVQGNQTRQMESASSQI